MSGRFSALVVVLAFAGSCGPEEAAVPRSGVYDVMIETIENDCDPPVQFMGFPNAIRFVDDTLTLGHYNLEGLDGWCSGCLNLTSWEYPPLARDPETGQYIHPASELVDVGGCLQSFPEVVAEVLDAETVRAVVTDEWVDAGGCRAVTKDRCTIKLEYTYTLIEVCEDCSLDELRERARALYAAEHPLPK